MTDTLLASGEITNGCSCLTYEDENGNEVSIDDNHTCYGDCWEFAVEDFAMATEDLRKTNKTGWWRVEGLQLWDGGYGGYFFGKTAAEIIDGMTVRSEWTMRYEVFADRIEYSLAHHDAPMGSRTTMRVVDENEREQIGLLPRL